VKGGIMIGLSLMVAVGIFGLLELLVGMQAGKGIHSIIGISCLFLFVAYHIWKRIKEG